MSKISELTEATSVAATDLVAVVVDPGTTPVTKKATIETIAEAVGLINPSVDEATVYGLFLATTKGR